MLATEATKCGNESDNLIVTVLGDAEKCSHIYGNRYFNFTISLNRDSNVHCREQRF